MVEKLNKQFKGVGEVKEFNFTQLASSSHAYMYQVEYEGCNHYEVFEKKTVFKCIDFEKRIWSETDKREKYPKANDFGKWAWTFRTLCRAKERFNSLELS